MGVPTSHQTPVDPMLFDEPNKVVPIAEKTDYSGAHEKTDPKEIALVKKLDRWILVSKVGSAPVRC